MKAYIVLFLGAAAALFIWLAPSQDYAAQARAAEQAAALAPLDIALAAGWRVLPFLLALAFGALAVLWFAVRLRLVRVDGAPVRLDQLREVSPAVIASNAQARIEQARRPNVPVHYAPHVTYQNKGGDALAPEAEAASLALPGITDLAEISHTPTPQSILLGLASGGAPITVPAKALCHVALCGATGAGKSNLMRLLLPQLQAMGARVVLADPHYTDFDADSGDDWRAIRARLVTAPARHPKDIDILLTYLTRELGERLDRRERGEPAGRALFLALDELPVIASEVKDAPARIGKLLREGRKVGLYVIGASQDFLIKTVGGTSGARDCYRTAFYVGGDLVSARALLDMPQREIDEGALQTGVAYLRSAATSHAQLVRVPLASNRAISRMLGSGAEVGREVATEVPTSRRPSALNPKAAQVRALIARKASQNEIIKEVWGATSGRAYQAAADELRDVMVELVGGA